MALRPDSVYRVDLGEEHTSASAPTSKAHRDDSGSPPKILQIRLTEHAIHELALLYSRAGPEAAVVRIDVDASSPVLLIGDTSFSLQAPLRSTSSTSSTSNTALNELFQLSSDESTLIRVGAVSSKLSVKPTKDVSSVSHRLKQQREEEEQRREERRRAVMQGTSLPVGNPKRASSASRLAHSSITKSLITAKTITALGSSPLSRSSSLNRLPSTRKDANASGDYGSSEQSLLVHSVSHLHDQRASQQPPRTPASPSSSATGLDRATTNSPESRKSHFRNLSSDLKVGSPLAGKELRSQQVDDEDAEEGHVSDGPCIASIAVPTRPSTDSVQKEADGADASKAVSTAAAGKRPTTKLTTRQRLAKAAKAGSRILPENDRKNPSVTPGLSKIPSSSSAAASKKGVPSSTRHPATDTTVVSRPPSVTKTDEVPAARRNVGSRATSPNRLNQGHPSADASPSHEPKRPGAAPISASRTKAETRESELPSHMPIGTPANVATSKSTSRETSFDSRKPSSRASAAGVQVISVQRKKRAAPVDSEAEIATPKMKLPGHNAPQESHIPTASAQLSSYSTFPRVEAIAMGTDTQDGRKRRKTDNHSARPNANEDRRREKSSPEYQSSAPDTQHHGRERVRVETRPEISEQSQPKSTRTDPPSSGYTDTASRSRANSQSQYSDLPSDVMASTNTRIAKNATTHPYEERDRSVERKSSPCPPLHARTVKGVGPGASHWSEPWLDVRSRSDWHRLAQRFAKTQQDYLARRATLEEESERLDVEMELARMEEAQIHPRRTDADSMDGTRSQGGERSELGREIATEDETPQGLLFSAHNSVAGDQDKLARETAVNTAINASNTVDDANGRVTRSKSRRGVQSAGGDAGDSPEEGEMSSSDEAEPGNHSAPASDKAAATPLSTNARRSESPENLAWRDNKDDARARIRPHERIGVASAQPMSYKELAERVNQLNELHGSLSRMHKVLVEFKGKGTRSEGGSASHGPVPLQRLQSRR